MWYLSLYCHANKYNDILEMENYVQIISKAIIITELLSGWGYSNTL